MKPENKEKNKKEELAKCQKLKEEYLNEWKRVKADFLNYKNEEGKRISGLIKLEKESIVSRMFPILDNFYLAKKHLPEELKDNQWVEGVLKIKKQILDFLRSQGVEEIKAMGEMFDPSFHEAIEEVERPDLTSRTVVEEIKKGYIFQGRVIRPAKVKIAK